jgi:hypothetical protein
MLTRASPHALNGNVAEHFYASGPLMALPIVHEVTSLRWADVKKVEAGAGVVVVAVVAVVAVGGPMWMTEQWAEGLASPRPSALQLRYAPSAAEILRRNR